MTKYRRVRKRIAGFLARIIHWGNQTHIKIHKTLELLEEGNLTVWKFMGLLMIRLYAWVFPRNGDNDNDEIH